MKKKFSIGETAGLYNISIQTLRYYDRIDLLKPAYVDKYNGYRYYGEKQLEQLATIKYLKTLGLSLKEIHEFLYKHGVSKNRNTLTQHREVVQNKIDELLSLQSKIDKQLQTLDEADKAINCCSTGLKNLAERRIVMIKLHEPSYMDFTIALEDLSRLVDSHIEYQGKLIVLLPKESILQRNFADYKAVCFEDIMQKIDNEYVEILPSGTYAYAYHKGSYDTTYKTYAGLLDFINNNGHSVDGDAIEISIIDPGMTSREEEFLTEIQIPIKRS